MSDLAIINQAVIDVLKNDLSLSLKDVYYGDQAAIPRTPCATVEISSADREYNQTGMQTNRVVQVTILVYHGLLADVQKLKKQLDEYTQEVEDTLHVDNTLGGLVISGIVTSIESGIIGSGMAGPRSLGVGNVQFYAHRLIWEAMIKERIGV